MTWRSLANHSVYVPEDNESYGYTYIHIHMLTCMNVVLYANAHARATKERANVGPMLSDARGSDAATSAHATATPRAAASAACCADSRAHATVGTAGKGLGRWPR